MKKINDFIMKVKKIFHQDPESLRLKEEEARQKRLRDIREIQELIAEYERKMYAESSEEVEPRRRRERRKKSGKEKESWKQKELADQQKSEK